MYNSLKTHYNNDDISERKQEYYRQILEPNRRSISPHKTCQIKRIPQPGKNYQINELNNYTIQSMSSSYSSKKQVSTKGKQKQEAYTKSNNQQLLMRKLRQIDPERYNVLKQKQQLLKKLDFVTFGIPISQNSRQNQLLSNQFIIPRYKFQNIETIKQQESEIKALTNEIMENEKKINRMNIIKSSLVQRVNRIRGIDQQIYTKLDQDRTKQIQNYLRLAKNFLAEGQDQDKIISILKKILY